MTSNHRWQEVGMGESGETFLLGEDSIFRSSPRAFLENPKKYLEIAKRNGRSEKKIEQIRKTGTPVLVQANKSQALANSFAERTGTINYTDYRRVPAVASYQPIRFGPFDWALIAKIDQAELFSGIRRLARDPLPVAADDEFVDLATAFNTMSDKLGEREESLKQQVLENDRLPRSILPASVAARMKQGAEAGRPIRRRNSPNVSVLFAEIEGWNDLSQSLSAEDATRLFHELHRALGTTYLAVSGLSRLRENHEQRGVDRGMAMHEVVRRFNHTYNTKLSLDIGVRAGPLTTGVVRGDKLSFDIWGSTINIARGINASSKHDGIQVTAPIMRALRGLYRFNPLPPILLKGDGEMATWEVEGSTPQPSAEERSERTESYRR